MTSSDVSFECGEESFVVRRFSLREAISTPFELSLVVTSVRDDLTLESFVGRGAACRVDGRGGTARVFRGVCEAMELVRVEADFAEYVVRIVPELRLLEQRHNYRIFQHKNAPSIVREILDEWGIEATLRLDADRHPDLEYRVQHGESDLSFVCRIMEEAGISYFFETEGDQTRLVLSDAPHAAKARELPIPYVDRKGAAEADFISAIRVREQVRPGRVTIRDYDFRRSAQYELIGRARTGISEEDRFERYRYQPGAFVVESRDDGGSASKPTAKSDEREAQAHAERRLAAERVTRQTVAFETNVFELAPGVLFSVDRHPRSDLGLDRRFLVIELGTEWSEGANPISNGSAVFAGRPFVPARVTEKPRVLGVESAVVVGPVGEEIHTDEFGRVRVQFHWDRDGQLDERSSCFIRVSQGWAGGAFGMIALPRVGQEVIVGYLDGDPDQPLVVGRLFNGPSSPPYKLPEHRTRSTWKSQTSPGGEGFNELTFEDAKGAELVYLRAERNLDCMVKADESQWIGNDRKRTVGRDETVHIGRGRATAVTDTDATTVGVRHSVSVEPTAGADRMTPTGIEMVDGRITLSSGQATITLDGPNLTLDAAAGILLRAASEISLEAASHITAHANVSLTLSSGATLVVKSEAGDVIIQGGPIVRINPEVRPSAALRTALQPENALRSVDVPPGLDIEAETALAEEHARFDDEAPQWFTDRLGPGGPWDYERLGPEYARYASFHLGVMGKAMGLPEGALLRQAGAMRRAKGGSKPEWGDPGNGIAGGVYPYGADPEHQEMLLRGCAYYERRFG